MLFRLCSLSGAGSFGDARGSMTVNTAPERSVRFSAMMVPLCASMICLRDREAEARMVAEMLAVGTVGIEALEDARDVAADAGALVGHGDDDRVLGRW